MRMNVPGSAAKMCDLNSLSTGVVQEQEYFEQFDYQDGAAARDFGAENIAGSVNDNNFEDLTEPKVVDPENAILIIVENFHVLKTKLPDAKSTHLWGLARDCLKKEDSAIQYAEDLINTGDYPIEVNDDDFCEFDEPDAEFNAAMKYCSLRSILPEADTTWVWGVAKEHADANEDVFNKLVMHLYETDHYPKFNFYALPPEVGIELKKQEFTHNAQEILHNIDALYIEQQLNADTALGYNEEGVSQLILNCINNIQTCPSKSEEYYRQITQEAIGQYTDAFDTDKFLLRFPNPVKYFEHPTNPGGPKYRSDIYKYLRVVAHHLSNEQIRKVQKSHVSLIRCHRSFFGYSVPESTIQYQLTDECVRFIHELTYIRFYEIIVPAAAIQASLTVMENTYNTCESWLYDFDAVSCELCEEAVSLRKVLQCTEAHMFCVECVRNWANETLGNGGVFVKCLQDCTGTMPDNVLARVLPEGSLERLIKRRQDLDVVAANVDGIIHCPWCDYSYVPRIEDMDLVCLSPECGERWCKKCRELAHHPKPCEDTPEEVRKRVYIEERMTKAAVRSCPNCKVDIVKDGGCDHVTCTCGVGVCFNCGQVADHHQCGMPRASFDVRAEGQQAKADANQLYPNIRLNYDPTRLV